MKWLYVAGLICALEIWGASSLLKLGDCDSLYGDLLSITTQDLRGLQRLPWTVSLPETQEPGSVIHTFSFNCSCPPTLELSSVIPPSSFFNQPSLSGYYTQYLAKVTLSSAARLDARQVNHYQLNLKLTCIKDTWNLPLSVDVHEVHGHPICLNHFNGPVGDKVQVLETVEPQSLIYVVLLRRGLTGIKMAITNPQDTKPFSINELGQVLTPREGLIGSAYKHFQLKILVTDGQGNSCQGILTVEVLPNPSNKISFGIQFQTFNISEDLVAGGMVGQVQANGSRVRYEITEPIPCSLYSISSVHGLIQITTPLDLERNPGAAVTKLQVKAYDPFQPSISDQISVTINVRSTNTWAPRCTPALLVTQVPETIPVGSILMTLTCSDPDSSVSTFHYQLWHHNETKSYHSFHLQGPVLQVNKTLDYDSSAPDVQYRTTILVTDSGYPPQTSHVPVLVTVTPVNEYSPICPAHTFLVREDAPHGKLIGTVLGSDRDYPPNSIEYHISSSDFYIDPCNGNLHLLTSLDYEKRKTYVLVIFVTDRDQDQDSTHRRSGSCTITVEVQNVNDHAPECEPPFQELTISSGPNINAEVTRLTCSDKDMPEQAPGGFSFTIVGGNSNGRFYMKDNILFHKVFSFQPDGLLDPYTYELLVRVTDKGPTLPLFSATAIVIVHVIPWMTTVPATSTKPLMISSPTALLVTRIEDYWAPEAWFVVVLTVTGVLLFIVLGWLLCRWPGRMALCRKTCGQSSQTLLLDGTKRNENSSDELREKKNDDMNSILSLQQFDGRAQDPARLERGAGSEDNLNSRDKNCCKKLVAVWFFWKRVRYIKGIQLTHFPCWSHPLLSLDSPPPAPPFLFYYLRS
ncbi:LOW QUALITY PROTEIN: cadherin-related family member 4 [Macrotis lagotis]|uniref:LOW QUALITY PROTEIN: cadherin-related family member 4 n=1 Tax=Macrotis lagotis TaxID=92651 RepID=UPI003D685DA4